MNFNNNQSKLSFSTLANTLFLILCFLCTTNLKGQNYFQDIYWDYFTEKIATAVTHNEKKEIAFTGTTRLVSFFDDWNAKAHLYITKTTPQGTPIWNQVYYNDNELYPKSIKTTADQGYIISGTAHLENNEETMFLLKVDKNGKQQWIQYYFHSPTAVGNTFNFEGSNLNYAEEIPSGGFIATGNTSIYNEVSQEYEIAAIVLKVKADGYLENQKIIRLGGFSQGVTIKAMGEEGFALLTECSGSGGHINPVVVRLNNQLNMVWNRFIGQKNNALFAADLTVTAQNEIAITGMLYQDQVSETYAYLVKLKANGNIDWYNSMHYREASTTLFPKSLEQDAEGNFYISGDIQYVENYWTGTGTHSTSSEDATFVIKTNKNGLGQWAVENGQNQRVEYSTDLTVYPNGDFVQSGHLGAIMDFKSYIVKGNAQGRSNCDNLEHNLRSINFKYVHNVVGVEVKEVNIIELEKEVERADNYYLRDRCGATIYNAKVAPQSTTPIMAAKKERAGVFPNPNSGNFSIRLKENIPANSINKLIILDAQGKKLVERSLQDRETNLSLEEYGKGIYLVQIAMGNQIENHKVVVQ
jgi:hypothetical protein